jgi:hypothetical protein
MPNANEMPPTERMYVELAGLIRHYCQTYNCKPYQLGTIALNDTAFPRAILKIAGDESEAEGLPPDYLDRLESQKTQTVKQLAMLEHFILHCPVSPAEHAARQVA